MEQGRLRVYLGAAPGVGKTYQMLREGARLQADGHDVIIAVVETHGRRGTQAAIGDLESVPRRSIVHRGIALTEMDLDAVLARRPEVALVDELAHTNVPGSQNEKRWQDVRLLLDAGIHVLSTVNVQHIESLNDVVEHITQVPQRETIPDAVLRSADQTEVVDLTPLALRDRLSAGEVYPAERIDAALSNYFRLGNLTALRELALLWLADEVDSSLLNYRSEHGIDTTWEARERVVVALTGGIEGETLLRRGARIAARSSGGEIVAVHVTSHDGLRKAHPEALARQRALVEELGGTFHQVVGDDISTALVEFAKGTNATQLVIGVSRRGRIQTLLTGQGIGAAVTRHADDIDVHIVTHSAAGGRSRLPRSAGALSMRRRVGGFVLALVLGPLMTLLLSALHTPDAIVAEVLGYQLLVIATALIGGMWPSLFAAVLSGLTLDYVFIDPVTTITISEPLHVLALSLYIVNGFLVASVVGRAARRSRIAARAAAESELLATTAGSVLRGENAVQALVSRTREAFGFTGVRLVSGEMVICTDGEPTPDDSHEDMRLGDRATLELYGGRLEASERRLLTVIATQLETALRHSDLERTASTVGPLAQSDRVRSALLSAVSHDLRRPLTAAIAAVGSLRSRDIIWSNADRDELLATTDESLAILSDLVTNLLDVSRLEAGALAVSLRDVSADAVIVSALDELDLGPANVELDLGADVSAIAADQGLLERVVVNVLANAVRFSPAGRRVRVSTSALGESVEIRVADFGPGVPDDRKDDIFVPFQRLGDTDNLSGLGLGLALSKGFVEGMGGRLIAEDTPGGGLTMVIALSAATGNGAES